jgi:hypothetical protein
MSGSSAGSTSRGRWVRTVAPAVALFAALSFVLTGCSVEVGLTTTVKNDGSGSTGVRLAVDKELQNALLQAASGLSGLGDLGSLLEGLEGLEGLEDLTPENIDMLLTLLVGSIPTDWSLDQGTDDAGARWVSLSHDFADLEELEELTSGRVLSTFFDSDRFSLTQDEGFFRTKTIYSTTIDPSGVMQEAEESDLGLPMEMLGEVFTLENRVTLPGVIKDNNADDVEGNTLVWDVGISGSREMHGESVTYDWAHIGPIAFVALVGLIILTLLVIWLVRRRRRGRQAEVQQAPPPPPAQPSFEVPPPPVSVPTAPPVPQVSNPPEVQELTLGRVTDEEQPSEEA